MFCNTKTYIFFDNKMLGDFIPYFCKLLHCADWAGVGQKYQCRPRAGIAICSLYARPAVRPIVCQFN